mmetsp:Transcript_28963/g.35502  ORF Transcript_28963/g.35502 Transcript_28963/m.35502 type:complete len:471 (+) Transcript_28963:805-2217(+)|eukprot:CAMPEP_0114685198 /NCGR_PEP_ID=MMETSP0191-20121206/60171_1 /TAXON_ID=126664 /ORGANISM="Sorites sp." /LENGTH=470 /DNA_ID=CAMNT_0001969307 /DNA_START=728 /DNA_END=2140 /DNA_ORIENTATION=+
MAKSKNMKTKRDLRHAKTDLREAKHEEKVARRSVRRGRHADIDSSVAAVKARQQTNANSFAAGLLDPAGRGRGVRVPDEFPFPSTTATLHFTGGLVEQTLASGEVFQGAVWFPDVNSFEGTVLSTSAGKGNLTFSTLSDVPMYSDLNSNFVYYRTCNLQIDFQDVGPLLERGSKLVIGCAPKEKWLSPPSNVYTTLQASEYSVVISSSDVKADDSGNMFSLFWNPISGESPIMTSGSGIFPTALQWRAVDSQSIDMFLYAFVDGMTTTPTNVSDTLQYEITMNIEAIPIVTSTELFSLRSVQGGPAEIAASLGAVEGAAKKNGKGSQFMKGVLELGRSSLKTVGKSLVGSVKQVGKDFLAAGMAALPGLLAFSDIPHSTHRMHNRLHASLATTGQPGPASMDKVDLEKVCRWHQFVTANKLDLPTPFLSKNWCHAAEAVAAYDRLMNSALPRPMSEVPGAARTTPERKGV